MKKELSKIQRCEVCKKIIGSRRKTKTGLCNYHYTKSERRKEYYKEYRQRPEIKERTKIYQKDYQIRRRKAMALLKTNKILKVKDELL